MKKIKDIINGIVTAIAAFGIITLVIAWLVTIISGSFGLAAWTTQWFWSLI